MLNVKRVLWVEDNEIELNDSIRSLFVNEEKKSIDNIQNALKEISSEHLYDYDTIVLDIDFRDDRSSDFQEVINTLKGKIYLKKDQCNENFIKENGGYLLFLYLLERGYPSDRIAFLTGNQDIIDKLQRYTLMNQHDLSREEIAELYKQIWLECKEEWEEFERQIFNLSGTTSEVYIDPAFTESGFVDNCVEALENEDYDQLLRLIKNIKIVSYDSQKDNNEEYENDMIFRFHRANLESPIYFSKHTDDIPQHNLEDARIWLRCKGSSDRIFRWLVLNASDYIEALWRTHTTQMTSQIRSILFVHNDNNSSYDFGIRNAFRQMFFVFDGMKAIEHAGVHYQAVSAMLVPFESSIKNNSTSDIDLLFRRKIAFCAKYARNYCAHNYWGSSISDKNALFLLMITITSILDKNQREQFVYWYERVRNIIVGANTAVNSVNGNDIDDLITNLWTASPCKIDTYNCSVPSSKLLSAYDANDYLVVLGWHKNMKSNTSFRERYYIFTLAVHIYKVLDGCSIIDIQQRYGESVKELYDVSKYLISTYNYREPL